MTAGGNLPDGEERDRGERRDGGAGADGAGPDASDADGAGPDGAGTADAGPAGDAGGRLSIPLETLAVLNWLGEVGVEGVEERLSLGLADRPTVRTERVKIGYTERATVAAQFGAAEQVGVWIGISNVFEGHVLVLFPVRSGENAAEVMVRNVVEDLSTVPNEMGRDALTELGNMMANGFVDRWATAFDTPIDTRSPIHVQNPERTLVRHTLNRDVLGLYLTARLSIPAYDVEAAVYVFPGEAEFVTKLSGVGIEVVTG